ncbi:uncharacterized protein LOC128256191 isoform X27 [Drosophila gunungcola]|uniref:uncharacterized protein LOC128256191 isoform X27 n=1 Tax=Drosophila gunungcola TaxID=103775 RepID=UPI0022E42980|nr:uncharacterized protein LOC128256191 isoform X27 [Drosophila gunungcola]
MPNNRNRNRNRNRNKRNRNQNQNQNQNPNQNQNENENNQQQAEGAEEREEQQEQQDSQIAVATSSSSIDDNGNSGSVSNGPAENSEAVVVCRDQSVTSTLEKTEEIDKIFEKPATVIQQEEDLHAEMGAKNSKHRKEKSDKPATNGRAEEQVRPPPTIIRRPPGSPRQAKVIVHRIVREEEAKANGQVEAQQQHKVAESKEQHLEVEASKKEAQQKEATQEQLPETSQLLEDAQQQHVAVAQSLEVQEGKEDDRASPKQDEVDNSEKQPLKVEHPKQQTLQQEPKEPEQYVLQLEKAMEFVENAHQQHMAVVQNHQKQEDIAQQQQQHEAQDQQEVQEAEQQQELNNAQQQHVAVAQSPNDQDGSNAQQQQPVSLMNNVHQQNVEIASKSLEKILKPVVKPEQHSSKVIIHQIRLETNDEERARKGKPTFEEISSTSGSLAGTLSPPPRYLVESPKNVSSGGQFSRFSRDVQIQELELNSDCSSGEFNSLQSPLVCEADSESEGSAALGPERCPSDQQVVPSGSGRVEQQEQLRQKRAQKRNALESHFLPQLLNPRYLDSILEENGGEAMSFRNSSNSSDQAGMRTPKLNETFPKSQLDFSRRHKRREEAPLPLKLETKLLEESADLESCTRLQSALSPQSEDAELVYLSSSASSSVSDLMELELEQAAALAERALVDLDTDASRLILRPDDEMSSTSTTTADRSETEAETETEMETETEREGEGEAEAEESRESTPVNPTLASSLSSLLSAATPTPTPTPTPMPADREQLAKDTNVSGGSAVSFGTASPLAATREEFVRNMDKVRELIEMTRREEEMEMNMEVPSTGTTRSPSPPPVPPPPVESSTPSATGSSSLFHLTPLHLRRQESNDSHCSDSTTHSQCTAINVASPPPTAQPPTPPLRQKPAPPPPPPQSPPPTTQSEPELSVADSGDADADAIKKLRLLCTEQLASMPYGEQVLEELASVAQNIADQSHNKMPYPLPQLPHIKELQLNAGEGKSSSTSFSSSAWLGLPTQSDPQLLVCLSPGQRELLDAQTQPDDLLDAHQKFVERRGYHELTKAQVLEQDQQQQQLQQQQQSEMLKTAAMMRELRKSLSPPAPPLPPPPVPLKSAETAAKATARENAKRDDASEQKQMKSSSLENKPRRAADLGEQQQQQQQSAEHRQSSSITSTTTSEAMSSAATSKFPTLDSMESELARMFPQHKGDIFEEQRKRFSNIEFPSSHSQQTGSQSQTKRYSNIETSSYESKKRLENGQVVYDVSTSSREKKELGDPPKEQPAPPPIPPPPIMSATKLNGGTFIDGDVAPKNSQPTKESGNGTYEEFRQRAKAAADAFGDQQQQNGLDHDRVFKDFDRLSQQMHAELQSSRERREKSASLYDLSGFTRPAAAPAGHPKLEELQQRRHAHMQELEKEIERSAKSRLERMSSVPRQMEATTPQTHEIPIELESRSRRAESLCNLNEPPPRPHTTVGHYSHQAAQDDWSRYASDLGYSENIARPFAREVEICYQRQNQRCPPHGIRAPRLSASTNDLSSSSQYSFDSFNAYGGRRTHAPMLNQAQQHQQQQQRPHYGSCYSMIERDPNPRYISTTSRRGVSPAPPAVAPPPLPLAPPQQQQQQQQQVPPPAYDRQQRRSSLPRELHEQQLKYILSKEEELKFEVERLQQERRRLMEEMQRAPVLPAPQRRESYRPAAKLPTLSEDEVFRQQMAEEWMNKVAEREERRQHKIIRISKIEDEQDHSTVDRATISDEFLDRVKERRHKLAMPADSDWESGAESQPQPQAQSQPESDVEAAPVRILEGQAEANLRQLPRHLREFAKFSTSEQLPDGGQMERHEEQERREEATDNSHSSATKKTSIVKTYKVSRLPPSVQARPSYKSNGYVSEPEPNYDSDYSTLRYRTPNPHRVQSVSSAVNVRNLNQDEKLYGTMPNPIKSAQNSYKNQPGRIENYTTGHSSVSEKEKKENLEQSKLSPLYTEGNLSRALAKESGYTSDSNLVFRKKELPVSSPLSPVEQKQAYKSLQAGGEPPLLGFRKPAPEKPRDLDPNAPPIPPQPPVKGLSAYDFPYNTDTVDGSDVNIHFKTPIRHEQRQNVPEEELAIRQAEHMQKLYHEERRRKYLQELQDMNSRRHTDNFTPSQKSPIALNRYDDFPTDVTLKSLVGPKTVARALFNFQGQSSKELTFRKGDTIYIRRQIDANWYEGEHNAMIGLLPASYVEIVSRDGARTPSKRPSEGQARAKYNFQAQSGVELSLNKGELVTLTRRVDGNWFEGKIANRKGIFPCSYVEVLTDIGAEDIAARTTTVITSQSTTNLRPNLDVLRTNINNEFNTLTQNGVQPPNGILKETRTLHKTDALHVDTSSEPLAYRALYKYRPQNSDELELLEGDVVHVLEKCDDGWFVGTSQRTGCFGTFPGNYVERA